jgi:hypothetical protein
MSTTTKSTPTLAELMMTVLDRLADGDSFNDVVEETGITARVAEAIQKQSKPAFYIVQEGGSSEELYVHGFDSSKDAEAHRVSCSKSSYRTTEVVEVPGAVANCDGNFDQALADVLKSMSSLESVDVPEGEEHVYISPGGDEFVVTQDGNVDGPVGEFLEKLKTAYGRMTFDEIDPETIAGEIGLELLEA